MKDYHDILISFDGEDYLIYVYNKMGDRVLDIFKIDPVEYEILFGLHDVMVSRCKVSSIVFDKLIEFNLNQEVLHHEYYIES